MILAPYIFPTWGYWRFNLWVGFLVWNWVALVALDGIYRAWLLPRRQHFNHSTVFFSVHRAVTMMLYPLSDLVLFVVPTFHAHLRMALSTSFTYIVAPKGPTPAGQTTATATAATPAPAAARMAVSIALPALSKKGSERAPLLREVVLTESFGSTGTTPPGARNGNDGGGRGGGAGGRMGPGPGPGGSIEYRSPTLNVDVPVSAACLPVPLSAHARRHSGTPPSPVTTGSSPTDSSSSTDSFSKLPLLHIQG